MPPEIERSAFSIPEFCQRVGISKATFYNLVRRGQGPDMMRVGGRRMISVAAEQRWIVEREVQRNAAE